MKKTYNLDKESFEKFKSSNIDDINTLLSNVYTYGYEAAQKELSNNNIDINEIIDPLNNEFELLISTIPNISKKKTKELIDKFNKFINDMVHDKYDGRTDNTENV